MADIFDTVSKQDIFDTLGQEENAPQRESLKDIAIGGGATALGAYGLYKGAKSLYEKYKQPWYERNDLIQQIKNEQAIAGIPETKASMLPKKISEITKGKQREYTLQKNLVNSRSNQAIGILKQRLNEFDNTILSSKIEDLASNIKSGYPQWTQGTYNGYRIGLDAIEGFMADKGVQFNTLDFDTKVINKTLQDAIREGVPEEKLSMLSNRLKQKILPSGEPMPEKPISFTEAKGYVRNIAKDLPKEAQYKITENWGNYLEQYAPQEVKGQLNLLNTNYKPFAQARTTLRKFMNPTTGEFDIKGLTNYLAQYTKSKIDTGTQNLMKLLGKGNEIVSPIEGVQEKFTTLEGLKIQRGRLKQAPLQAGISRKARLNIISQQAKNELDRLGAWKQKSEELISKARVAQAKVEGRSIARRIQSIPVVGQVGKWFQKGLPILGAFPMISDAIRFSQDPEGYMYRLETSGLYELPTKGTPERIELDRIKRKYQSGQPLTNEEKIKVGLVI